MGELKQKRGDGLTADNPSEAVIYEGLHLDCSEAKFGYNESNQKYWMLIQRKAQRGFNKIWVFVNNAEEMRDMSEIVVKKITRVTCGSKRRGDGTFYNFCNANIDADGTDEMKEQRNDGFNAFQDAIVGKENLPFN